MIFRKERDAVPTADPNPETLTGAYRLRETFWRRKIVVEVECRREVANGIQSWWRDVRAMDLQHPALSSLVMMQFRRHEQRPKEPTAEVKAAA